jgi:hypothetical protein
MIRKSNSLLSAFNQVLLLILLLTLPACNLPGKTAPMGNAQAWIDAPLDGMVLPLAPYTIVFHSTDPLGVTRMEVSVNGQVLASLPNPDLAQGLVHLEQVWQPEKAGRFVIRVRAQNLTGTWTEQDIVSVVIEDVTRTPTPTPTQTATLTVTTTVTPTSTPTKPPAAVFSNLQLSTNVFYRLDNPLRSVTFTIQVNDPAGIKLVEIYFRLKNPDTNATTDWGNEDMVPTGGGVYTYKLDKMNPALLPFPSGTRILVYQFIVTHPDLSLTRSQVYSDVTYK